MARKSAAKHRAAQSRRDALKSWAVVGIDASVTSLSGAMLVYDSLLDKLRGPEVFSHRWKPGDHFLDRLAYAVRADKFIHELLIRCGPMPMSPDNIWIGVEEAWPAGIVKRAESGWLRQQAEVTGAFRGGLVRHGYTNVYDVNAQSWRVLVARALGVKLNKEFTKWDVKKWAIACHGVEGRPDLIQTKKDGLSPQPPTSKAKPRQPDDIYDAVGIMNWMLTERETQLA